MRRLSLIAGVDVIDATRAKADWLDHWYVQENKALLDDMFMLLSRGLPPNERNLLAVRRPHVALPSVVAELRYLFLSAAVT